MYEKRNSSQTERGNDQGITQSAALGYHIPRTCSMTLMLEHIYPIKSVQTIPEGTFKARMQESEKSLLDNLVHSFKDINRTARAIAPAQRDYHLLLSSTGDASSQDKFTGTLQLPFPMYSLDVAGHTHTHTLEETQMTSFLFPSVEFHIRNRLNKKTLKKHEIQSCFCPRNFLEDTVQ